MTKTIHKCDRCGKKAGEDHISVVTGRSMDASGNGYEDDITYVDLCLPCLRAWAKKSINKIGHEEFLSFVKSK
jgi:hypothetical protein